jgi:hypothetical protein
MAIIEMRIRAARAFLKTGIAESAVQQCFT